jgi:pyruvate ferredoxin oxidoreductase delta subunit
MKITKKMVTIKNSFLGSRKNKRLEKAEELGEVIKSNEVAPVRIGNWKIQKPIAQKGCVGCGICLANCPEAAISLGKEKIKIDYDFCKGCGICAQVCPKKLIKIV